MFRGYKYILTPNKTQQILLNNTFGCVRYFWNKQVEAFNKREEFKSSTQYRNENAWMGEVSAGALQQKELDFKQYKNQRFSKTRKKSIGDPRFKRRTDKQSFRLPNRKFNVGDRYIRLEKIGKVKYIQDRPIPECSKLMSVTISRETDGKYYASVLVEMNIKAFDKTGESIGIDVGIKELATLSNGIIINNPKWFRNSQVKLKQAQRRLSKKKVGSSRFKKCKLKVAKLYKKIKNQREHYLHNFTTKIVKDYDVIAIEDLNISDMIKNKKLSKSISDASFGKIFSMLDYKCKWYGKELIKISRFAPSSKTCSGCGNIKDKLKLSEREYACENCGLVIDRDLNAAKNIKAMGVSIAI